MSQASSVKSCASSPVSGSTWRQNARSSLRRVARDGEPPDRVVRLGRRAARPAGRSPTAREHVLEVVPLVVRRVLGLAEERVSARVGGLAPLAGPGQHRLDQPVVLEEPDEHPAEHPVHGRLRQHALAPRLERVTDPPRLPARLVRLLQLGLHVGHGVGLLAEVVFESGDPPLQMVEEGLGSTGIRGEIGVGKTVADTNGVSQRRHDAQTARLTPAPARGAARGGRSGATPAGTRAQSEASTTGSGTPSITGRSCCASAGTRRT